MRTTLERRDDIAAGMRALCDCVGKLALVRDDVIESLKTLPPGHPDERLALGLTRTCSALTTAAATVPDECWDILLRGNTAGAHEVRRRVQTMIHNSMVMDGIVEMAVPA